MWAPDALPHHHIIVPTTLQNYHLEIERSVQMEQLKADKSGFRLRGDHMTRIDGFSDVVFGFALTILVVSLEVPKTYSELENILSGFLAFAICFYLLISFWYAHYKFFRRYDLSDMKTIFLNAILLFLILFFVYPMKFLFTLVTLPVTGGSQNPAQHIFDLNPQIANLQVEHLMMIYGFGFFIVHLVFALLHILAWSKRIQLQLNGLEKLFTIESIVDNIAVGMVGLICILLAHITRGYAPGNAGWAFLLIVPIQIVLRFYFRHKRKTLKAAGGLGPHS